jgi:hypothetical protein
VEDTGQKEMIKTIGGGGGGMETKDDLSITASFLTHDVWFINKDLNWFHTSHLSYDQLSLLLTKLIS